MDAEAELRKSVPEAELEKLVADKIRSFHGFLTRDVALRLIAKDRGLLRQEEQRYMLADIPKGAKRVSFSASVRKVWPVAEYSSGKRSRVVEVKDDSGVRPLVLWNDDVELARGMRLKDRLEVSGAYEKGGELHLGYSGRVEVAEKAAFVPLSELKEGDRAHVRAFVSAIEGPDSFVRDGREERGFSFMVNDGASERRCVVFEGAGRASKLQLKDEVMIEGARIRNGNIELDNESRLLYRRVSDMIFGTVADIGCVGERMRIKVDGTETVLERQEALKLLRAPVADDIALSTVVSLKKGSVLNTRIAVRIERRDGHIVVRC